MTELTITCTFMKDPGNDGRPVVQIGMSECPQEEARWYVVVIKAIIYDFGWALSRRIWERLWKILTK